MFKVWRLTRNDLDLVLPADQPAVLRGKLKIGDGTHVWDDLQDVGRTAATPRLLAFPFDSNTEGLTDLGNYVSGAQLTTDPLPLGTVIQDAWVTLVGDEQFDNGDDSITSMVVNAVPTSDPENYEQILTYNLGLDQEVGLLVKVPLHTPPQYQVRPVVLSQEAHLSVFVETELALIAGSATLYVTYVIGG